MRSIALLVATAALAGCLHTAEEQESVPTAWGDCVANVVRLDDGKSDPVSIAYGIAPQRGELHAQLTNIMVSHNITENGQIATRERMKSGEVQMITSAILTFRAARNRPVQPLDRHRAQARP
ncbi:MAG TPA: hypothetical protein VKE24_08565 [Candidatus Acidoferrales bacterium]|nr:hypothetical protein [Candidatus Acidoferrales bacterium]